LPGEKTGVKCGRRRVHCKIPGPSKKTGGKSGEEEGAL
jgi:hypothetical protein